jgi:uncharacterized protein (DUF2235 family)
MKRLVICCDGTWNSADQKFPTNVFKASQAIPQKTRDDPEGQLIYYDGGVGSAGLLARLPGLFGHGLWDNVKQAYRFLVDHHQPGDEIFLFGFSRGAYTVRSVVGMTRKCGVLRQDRIDLIDKAYDFYRDSSVKPASTEADDFRRQNSVPQDGAGEMVPRVKLLGVWDTVGSLGVPVGPLSSLTRRKHLFHDVSLSRIVDNAFQALAIDEKRADYRPTLWEQHADATTQRLEQRWFAGVHTDIGGGNADSGQSVRCLRWLLDRAEECGLVLDREFLDARYPEVPLSAIHESRNHIFKLRPMYSRPICEGVPPAEANYLGGLSNETVDSAVIDRNVNDSAYLPQNLVAHFRRHPEALAAARAAR